MFCKKHVQLPSFEKISFFQNTSQFENKSFQVQSQLKKFTSLPRPLLTAALTDKQWSRVTALNEKLVQDYRNRIQLLLKRLDVTIQSFTWSERIKKMEVSFNIHKCPHFVHFDIFNRFSCNR